jgi:hypothetical protein
MRTATPGDAVEREAIDAEGRRTVVDRDVERLLVQACGAAVVPATPVICACTLPPTASAGSPRRRFRIADGRERAPGDDPAASQCGHFALALAGSWSASRRPIVVCPDAHSTATLCAGECE